MYGIKDKMLGREIEGLPAEVRSSAADLLKRVCSKRAGDSVLPQVEGECLAARTLPQILELIQLPVADPLIVATRHFKCISPGLYSTCPGVLLPLGNDRTPETVAAWKDPPRTLCNNVLFARDPCAPPSCQSPQPGLPRQ